MRLPLLVRDSQFVKDSRPTIIPPKLDASPGDLQGCGWDVLSYLGLTFVLLSCLAVVVGVIACFCCCSRSGQSSNI